MLEQRCHEDSCFLLCVCGKENHVSVANNYVISIWIGNKRSLLHKQWCIVTQKTLHSLRWGEISQHKRPTWEGWAEVEGICMTPCLGLPTWTCVYKIFTYHLIQRADRSPPVSGLRKWADSGIVAQKRRLNPRFHGRKRVHTQSKCLLCVLSGKVTLCAQRLTERPVCFFPSEVGHQIRSGRWPLNRAKERVALESKLVDIGINTLPSSGEWMILLESYCGLWEPHVGRCSGWCSFLGLAGKFLLAGEQSQAF